MDLQIKSYGCLKFLREVWAGWACVGANEEELTNNNKFWGRREEGRGLQKWKTRRVAIGG
jgi:hypothetical protein